MEQIIGKTIERVFVAPGEDEIALSCAGRLVVKLTVYGDCCSESWFSDIYNFQGLLGTVAKVENLNLPDYDVNDGRGRQESDEVYGLKIVTDKGTATIAFRNSSNGYYGGSLNDPIILDSVPEGWSEITDDWKA